MRRIIFTLVILLFASFAYAGDNAYIEGAYAKDEITLGIMCSAIFDNNEDMFIKLYDSKMVKVAESPTKVNLIQIVKKEDALVQLPMDMVKFKLDNDYRTYYTITYFIKYW